MLIHMVPKIYTNGLGNNVEILDVKCPELNVTLCGDKDVVARRPFPNKQILVACRKKSNKAINGLLIQSNVFLKEFTLIARWQVGPGRIVTHRVRYEVIDDDYEAVSGAMMLWYGSCGELGVWEARTAPLPDSATPANCQPRMGLVPEPDRVGDIYEVVDCQDNLVVRYEVFKMPTLQSARITSAISQEYHRTPSIEDAFQAGNLNESKARGPLAVPKNSWLTRFEFDQWVEVRPAKVMPGDLIRHGHNTMVVVGPAYHEGDQLRVPAEIYDSGIIVVDLGSDDKSYIIQAQDLAGTSCQYFDDGTALLCDLEAEMAGVYSPRLPVAELNAFCEDNIKYYQSFYNENRDGIEEGESVPMEKFW